MGNTNSFKVESPNYVPLRKLPDSAPFKKGDVLVVFGELFSRGYANGIVDEAERHGLKVIRSTVGRRDADGTLRALNAEEVADQPKPFINIPLEAGFDMEPCEQDGSTPVDQLKSVKMSDWDQVRLDWSKIESSRKKGRERFQSTVKKYLEALESEIAPGANVIFVHTMAGGVPRAKILMATMNRAFKGVGDRHLSSEALWKSDIGRLCEKSFEDVTANTFQDLIELSGALREKIEKNGGHVNYLAYGYHGTEIMIRGEYSWQTYSPYIQGWAKMLLEDHAKAAWKKGIKATVFNCPEILTNSSSIFVGVEVPLYPLVFALKKEGEQAPRIRETVAKVQALLKPEHSLEEMKEFIDQVLTSETVRSHTVFEKWPQHNAQDQMEVVISASEKLVEMHQDPKSLITFVLSEEVFRATGFVMYHESWKPSGPVLWLGHDLLAKALASGKTL